MATGSLYALGTIFGGDPANPNALQRAGMAMHPEIANTQMQGQLLQAQYLQALMEMQKQVQVQGALKNMGTANPAELTKNLAMIDPKNYLNEYLSATKEGVSTSPSGALANYGAPQPQAAPTNGKIQLPAQPAIQPLYKNGVPLTDGLEDGFMWGADTQGNRVQIPIPGGQVEKGKQRFETLLADMLKSYEGLDKAGGIRDTSKPAVNSVGDRLQSSWAGQQLGTLFSTGNQQNRDDIKAAKPLLQQAIMQATGMSSKQLDSNRELQNFLEAVTDPSKSIGTALNTFKRLSALYGTGEAAKIADKYIASRGGESPQLTREQWLASRPGAKK